MPRLAQRGMAEAQKRAVKAEHGFLLLPREAVAVWPQLCQGAAQDSDAPRQQLLASQRAQEPCGCRLRLPVHP